MLPAILRSLDGMLSKPAAFLSFILANSLRTTLTGGSFREKVVLVTSRLSVNKSGCFSHVVRSHISVCLFCLLETTSLHEFMKSLPKSEFDILKYLGNIAMKTGWQDFFGLQDFDILARYYLKSHRDSGQCFGRLDFEISPRSNLKSTL